MKIIKMSGVGSMGLKVLAFPNSEQYPFWVSMVGTSDCERDYHIYRENSAVFSLEYVLDGKGYVSEDDKSVIAVKGDTWLLHAHCTHNYYTDPDKRWKKFGLTLAVLWQKALLQHTD